MKKLNKSQMIERNLKKYDIDLDTIEVGLLKEFKEYVKENITDPRQKGKIKYKIWDIIVTASIAILCNNNDTTEMHDFIVIKQDFFKKFLMLTHGIASQDTYERVLSMIDSKELEKYLNYFVIKILEVISNKKDIWSLDGKVDKGSSRNESPTIEEKIKPLNVLNLYSDNQSMCLYSEIINDKTNEITAIPNVLNEFNLKNIIITWDALNTQIKNIAKVIEKNGDYVVPVKANQGTFYEELKLYFDEDTLSKIRIGKSRTVYKKQIEKSNSNVVTYEYFQTEDIKWYEDKDKWSGLKSIGLVHKTIDKGNEIVVEDRYYISSLLNDIEEFARAIRNHWNVENKLHWQLDFTFKQDANTTMNKQLLFNIQIIKKFNLALLEKVKPIYGISMQRIRHRLELNPEVEVPRLFNILEHQRRTNF